MVNIMKKRYFIGGAWPYANNSLHVGHLAALLPGDVIARFGRMNGWEVIYVSGSDTHGTPITERAKREKVTPASIAERYHKEFVADFNDMLFSYDLYTATYTDYHMNLVREYFKKIEEHGYLYETTEEQDYCESCGQFLSDREVEGRCPVCKKITRGDQCEFCMASFDSNALTEKRCRTCGSTPSRKKNKHLVFALSKFQKPIEEFSEKMAPNWRWNAVNETKKYLSHGLPDRVATRDLSWGIEVPKDGYESKRVYVWIEAVLGYMTAGTAVAEKKGIDFNEYMKQDGNLNAYYVHGKDNIPFHTVIFPALEMAINPEWALPTHIVSSEYINMKNEVTSEEEKMSKSVGNIITVRELADSFPADCVRFYMILNNPERRDTAFSKADLIQSCNKILSGGFGNFVNRNLSFIKKKFGGVVQKGNVDGEVQSHIRELYESMGKKYDAAELRSAAEDMVDLISYANKYYDEKKPWVQAKEEDLSAFWDTTATCLYMMANMANLFAPIIPNGSAKLLEVLSIGEPKWSEATLPETFEIGEVPILYIRLEGQK